MLCFISIPGSGNGAKENDHTSVSVNHDHASPENIPLTEVNDGSAEQEQDKEQVKKKSRRKEQSILQAKLTKLAVQIGQAG